MCTQFPALKAKQLMDSMPCWMKLHLVKFYSLFSLAPSVSSLGCKIDINLLSHDASSNAKREQCLSIPISVIIFFFLCANVIFYRRKIRRYSKRFFHGNAAIVTLDQLEEEKNCEIWTRRMWVFVLGVYDVIDYKQISALKTNISNTWHSYMDYVDLKAESDRKEWRIDNVLVCFLLLIFCWVFLPSQLLC